jgi:hypothetical protein
MAVINTLQLAARKNLIQMSLITLVTIVTVIPDFQGTHQPTTCLDYFVFLYLKSNVFKNRPGTIPELMQIITETAI